MIGLREYKYPNLGQWVIRIEGNDVMFTHFQCNNEQSLLSIISPAYNESKNLPALVNKLLEATRKFNINAEIIIVNDGSTDDTAEAAKRLAEKFEEVRVIHHERNLGKTRATYSGIQIAQGEYVMLFESDLQYESYDIPKFIPLMRLNYDVINGYRKFRMDPLHRTLLSKFYNMTLRFLFGIQVYDANSGLKAFKREIALRLFNPTFIDQIGINIRDYHRVCLVIANWLGHTIDEVTVRHYRRKQGKSYITLKTPFSTLRTILKLKFYFWFRKLP